MGLNCWEILSITRYQTIGAGECPELMLQAGTMSSFRRSVCDFAAYLLVTVPGILEERSSKVLIVRIAAWPAMLEM